MSEVQLEELIDKIARKLAVVDMGCVIGGGRSEPMYYDVDYARPEYSIDDVWDRLSQEDQHLLRDYVKCCLDELYAYKLQQYKVICDELVFEEQ